MYFGKLLGPRNTLLCHALPNAWHPTPFHCKNTTYASLQENLTTAKGGAGSPLQVFEALTETIVQITVMMQRTVWFHDSNVKLMPIMFAAQFQSCWTPGPLTWQFCRPHMQPYYHPESICTNQKVYLLDRRHCGCVLHLAWVTMGGWGGHTSLEICHSQMEEPCLHVSQLCVFSLIEYGRTLSSCSQLCMFSLCQPCWNPVRLSMFCVTLKSGMQENSKNLAKFRTEKQWWHARSASCYGQDFQ